MTARIEDDTIYFSSGRECYANNGIVGLSPTLEVSEGYDGGIDWPPEWVPNDPEIKARQLTAEDMRELADLMIQQWTKFRATLE